jgi:hypothetical protein
VTCSEHLTWLAGQARAIGSERVHIVSYSDLCADPVGTLAPVADFCGIPFDEVRIAAQQERVLVEPDTRYRLELEQSAADWLEGFFDTRKRKQWEILEVPTQSQRL